MQDHRSAKKPSSNCNLLLVLTSYLTDLWAWAADLLFFLFIVFLVYYFFYTYCVKGKWFLGDIKARLYLGPHLFFLHLSSHYAVYPLPYFDRINTPVGNG